MERSSTRFPVLPAALMLAALTTLLVLVIVGGGDPTLPVPSPIVTLSLLASYATVSAAFLGVHGAVQAILKAEPDKAGIASRP